MPYFMVGNGGRSGDEPHPTIPRGRLNDGMLEIQDSEITNGPTYFDNMS
jgi:hypothetical protein